MSASNKRAATHFNPANLPAAKSIRSQYVPGFCLLPLTRFSVEDFANFCEDIPVGNICEDTILAMEHWDNVGHRAKLLVAHAEWITEEFPDAVKRFGKAVKEHYHPINVPCCDREMEMVFNEDHDIRSLVGRLSHANPGMRESALPSQSDVGEAAQAMSAGNVSHDGVYESLEELDIPHEVFIKPGDPIFKAADQLVKLAVDMNAVAVALHNMAAVKAKPRVRKPAAPKERFLVNINDTSTDHEFWFYAPKMFKTETAAVEYVVDHILYQVSDKHEERSLRKLLDPIVDKGSLLALDKVMTKLEKYSCHVDQVQFCASKLCAGILTTIVEDGHHCVQNGSKLVKPRGKTYLVNLSDTSHIHEFWFMAPLAFATEKEAVQYVMDHVLAQVHEEDELAELKEMLQPHLKKGSLVELSETLTDICADGSDHVNGVSFCAAVLQGNTITTLVEHL